MNHQQSSALFARAKQMIPGGVNSPVRAFKSVGCDPIFIARAAGSKVFDADGNDYIDYVGSWGPMILGHCHPQVVAAIQQTALPLVRQRPGKPSLPKWSAKLTPTSKKFAWSPPAPKRP